MLSIGDNSESDRIRRAVLKRERERAVKGRMMAQPLGPVCGKAKSTVRE